MYYRDFRRNVAPSTTRNSSPAASGPVMRCVYGCRGDRRDSAVDHAAAVVVFPFVFPLAQGFITTFVQ